MEVTTGGAAGVDAVAYRVFRRFPEISVNRLALPSGFRFDADVLADHEAAAAVGSLRRFPVVWAEGPMARNDVIVAHSDLLLAFPRTAVEETRSGTWATVRRARKAGVFGFPLDGAGPFAECDVLSRGALFEPLLRRLGLVIPV